MAATGLRENAGARITNDLRFIRNKLGRVNGIAYAEVVISHARGGRADIEVSSQAGADRVRAARLIQSSCTHGANKLRLGSDQRTTAQRVSTGRSGAQGEREIR